MLGVIEDGQWVNYGLTEEEYISPIKENIQVNENKKAFKK